MGAARTTRRSRNSGPAEDRAQPALDHCCIDDGLRLLLIMCYGADRLARCEQKKARCEKNRLHNASRASRPASPLSSPTDYARRSITAASTTGFDCFSSCATGPTVLPAAKRKKARCEKNRFHNASHISRPSRRFTLPAMIIHLHAFCRDL